MPATGASSVTSLFPRAIPKSGSPKPSRCATYSVGMYLALNAVPIGGKPSWREFAQLAANAGFGGVDVMLDAAMAEGVEKTRAMLADLHLRTGFISLPVDYRKDEATFRTGLAKL